MLERKYILETERLRLREMLPSDAEFAYQLNADAEVIRYTGDEAFGSVEDARQFLQNYSSYQQFGFGRWACELKSTGELIGWCGLKNDAGVIDLGYRFFRKEWNKGYASEAALACLNYGHKDLNMYQIIARANSQNIASIKVMQKIGMQLAAEIDCAKDDCDIVYVSISNQR